MPDLRLVHWESAADFVEATKEYDSNAMNFSLGSLLDNMDASQAESQARWGPKLRVLLGVYRGEELLLTLTRNALEYSWLMSHPSGASTSQCASEVRAAVALLVAFLPTITDPKLVTKISGPEEVVDAFLQSWMTAMDGCGMRLKALPPYFKTRACYATVASLATLPPHPPIPQNLSVALATGIDDIAALVPLQVAFSSHSPMPVTTELAEKSMREAVNGCCVWVGRVDGLIAAYAFMGRRTPRTIAIRNVFVLPEYRRRGIAEVLVTAATRFYLGVEHTLAEPKREVCLHVADPAVERIYKRCGFMLEDEAADPVSGKKGWYQCIFRGVELC